MKEEQVSSETLAETPSTPPPSRRRILWNTAGVAVALIAIVTALALWVHSEQFQGMVRSRLATQLQAMTGGRVEIGSFHWKPLKLEVEARKLVIHGDEQPNEVPYATVEDLHIRFSVIGVLSPSIRLRDLEILRPRMHLILYRDGATNQPHPRGSRSSGGSGLDTLFKMKAGHFSVEEGLIHVDDRAADALDFQNRYQPLDFQAKDVAAVMEYAPASAGAPERYHIETSVRDLDLNRGGSIKNDSSVHGVMHGSVDLQRNTAVLRTLEIVSEAKGVPKRTLTVTGSLTGFAKPQWQAKVLGEVDLRLLEPVFGFNQAPEGIASLNLVSSGGAGTFRADGTVRAENASYVGNGVNARGVDLDAKLHADPKVLDIAPTRVKLAQGGEMDGEVRLEHWLSEPAPHVVEAAPAPPGPSERRRSGFRSQPPTAPGPAHSMLVKSPPSDVPVDGKVTANFQNVALDTILDLVCPPPYQRLGLAAIVNGPATATWTHGDTNSLTISSRFNLAPSTRLTAGEVPTSGVIDASYSQRDGAVDVRALSLLMPASHFEARGHLGAYPVSSPTALTVDFASRNLGEFDTVLRDLGLSRRGKTGTAALPLSLGGQASFHGTWAGSLASPQLGGNLAATDISVEIPGASDDPSGQPKTAHWDSITANGAYNAERIAIVQGELRRGNARLSMDGTLTAAGPSPSLSPARTRKGSQVRGDERPAFGSSSLLRAHIKADRVDMADLLPLVGSNVPVTGSLNAQITAEGPLGGIGGTGWAQLNDGNVYGEPVSRVRAEGAYATPLLSLTTFSIKTEAGTVTGSGTLDLRSKRVQLEARGNSIEIERIEHLRRTGSTLGGQLTFALTASGTRDDAQIGGQGSLRGLTFKGQSLGSISLSAHTANHLLIYDAVSRIDSAQIQAHGQTGVATPYPTQAHIDFSQFDIGALMRISRLSGISAQSAIAGNADISGPLAHPAEMHGNLHLAPAQIMVAGVHLRSEGALHASLENYRLSLDPVHITGDDTDLRGQGSIDLQGQHRVDLAASGSINLKLAETIDSDVKAGGASSFQIEAHGTLDDPGLRGRIDFQNGSLALGDVPNSLSQLQGRLEFNQNRLEIKSLTAMTGGGQLNVGGYLAYQRGLYADLTISGRSVRIRYPQGVSSQADADLRLQGSQSSLLLAGNILLTRFSVSSDLDIAALAAQANTVQPIASPDAPSNHVRLDVRIQSSPQLNFQNAYAKLAGDVDLRLRGTIATPSLLGRISITEGNATIAGTRYELQRGDVTFTNPVHIQPNIDLNATARVEDYDITLGMHGTPDKMSVSYRSDPPLPEADVVALLALGRTQSEQGIYTQQQQQSAGLSPSTDVLLGGALNATVSSRVQKLFGAGSVKVDPSYLGALGNSTTRITVEEQVGKNITLTYATNVDTSAQQLLQAEIAINRHVSVQMTRDESGVFSMVLKATRRYK